MRCKRRIIGIGQIGYTQSFTQTSTFLKVRHNNLVYFRSPTDVAAGEVNLSNAFRLGGMVREGSLQRTPDTLKISFVVTDYVHDVPVHYEGVLPDLFREGQGVVTEGKLNDQGEFVAHTVLAKHDENYMPPEVADALEKAGKAPDGTPLKNP